jgi:hypothetical protein
VHATTIFLSTIENATLGGLGFGNDDLVEYNSLTDMATLFFDGGTFFTGSAEDIDAVFFIESTQVTPIPEPGTWLLMVVGLLRLIGYGWRRQQCAEKSTNAD